MLRLAAILCFSFAACLPCLAPAQERQLPKLSANLDALLNLSEVWGWTTEEFEKHYVVKLEDQKEKRCQALVPGIRAATVRRERSASSR